ncbi:MAG: hypothetical protein KDB07_01935, partial [Planctomycetes bacterium]|nr:hypothetical protein [Planctomycetota bacterium]
MKNGKQLLVLPILLMSCALSLSACFGGGEVDGGNGNGAVVEGDNTGEMAGDNTGETGENVTTEELIERERQDILASLRAKIEAKEYQAAVEQADEVLASETFASDEDIATLRAQAVDAMRM